MSDQAKVRLPDFLFVGPDKAGSTWLYEVLRWHPSVYVPQAKELFFFDRFWHLGLGWYGGYFRGAKAGQVAGELSHDYLFDPLAAGRIAKIIPNARLIVCLREPAARAFSSYLFMRRQGRTSLAFPDAIQRIPELIQHGLYDVHLEPYLGKFARRSILVCLFDDLVDNPGEFAATVFRFIGVEALEIPDPLKRPVLRAARPRNHLAALVAKKTANAIRAAGRPGVVGWIKSSTVVQRVLYQRFDGAKPTPDPHSVAVLRRAFADSVRRTEVMTGLPLSARWNYKDESTEFGASEGSTTSLGAGR